MTDQKSPQYSLAAIDFTAIDIDAYLDARDAEPFDQLWQEAYAAVEQAKAKERPEIIARLEQDSQQERERVFKLVYRATKNSELAAYISDDFDLISNAWWLGIADQPFLSQMSASYLAGKLPEAHKVNDD